MSITWRLLEAPDLLITGDQNGSEVHTSYRFFSKKTVILKSDFRGLLVTNDEFVVLGLLVGVSFKLTRVACTKQWRNI